MSPTPEPAPSDLQTEVLRAFTLLHALRYDWSGALILNLGLDLTGAAVSLASNIAGAVSLTIEPDSALVRNALRTGSCDFVVNTLDEALRAIKNEIRKHRPLSVGLQGDTDLILAEILERGVAPELFSGAAPYSEGVQRLQQQGTQVAAFDPGALNANPHLQELLSSRGYVLKTYSFMTSAEVRGFDLKAAAIVYGSDALRRKWLTAAGRILPRDRHRVLWLTEDEAKQLTS